MLTELWEQRDTVESKLLLDADEMVPAYRQSLMRELARLDVALGRADDGAPMHTGDPVTDYLIRRQMSGEITPEDLELTPEQILRILDEEKRAKRGRKRGV